MQADAKYFRSLLIELQITVPTPAGIRHNITVDAEGKLTISVYNKKLSFWHKLHISDEFKFPDSPEMLARTIAGTFIS
jgi:hypothetical protein